jgi:hypothetical protein
VSENGGLAEFITARLDEDEAAARESYYEGQHWLSEEEGVYRWPDDEPVHIADRKADARHIARHDPARVLREVEAKRKILAEHGGEHDPCDAHDAWFRSITCATLRQLGTEFSGHPDYLEEWKP